MSGMESYAPTTEPGISWYATGLVSPDHSQQYIRRTYRGRFVRYPFRLYAAASQSNGRWNVSPLHRPMNAHYNQLFPGAAVVSRSNQCDTMAMGWESANSAWLLVPQGGSIAGGFNTTVYQGDWLTVDFEYETEV